MKKEWKAKRKQCRYGKYYETIMAPIWEKQWDTELRRVTKLKKNILSLGSAPKKEVQVIKTTNYFVELINLLTSFIDEGTLKYAPKDKYDAVSRFNHTINFYVARNESVLCYLNKSEVKQSVTCNNLYIGLFENISKEKIKDDMKLKIVDDFIFNVLADYSPVIDWLNKKTVTINGNTALISQKSLLKHIEIIKSTVLEDIDAILN